MTTAELKTIAEILESCVKSLALVVGGAWTYLLFIKNRQKYPKALVTHDVVDRLLSDQVRLVHVVLNISNAGNVLLSLESARTGLYRVVPPPDQCLAALSESGSLNEIAEFNWPPIDVRRWQWPKGHFEVEPGERETFQVDYFIEPSIRAIQVHSYFKNRAKQGRDIGWNCSTLVDLGRNIPQGELMNTGASTVKEDPKGDDKDGKKGDQRPDDKGGTGKKG